MLIVNNTPIKNYKNLETIEEVSGSLTLSFTSFSMANNAHRYLNEEAVVTIAGYDFKIKQMTETTFSKSIQAVSTFFDLGGHYIDDMFAGTRKLSDLLNFIFKGTGWNYELDAPDVMLLVPNFGNDNALKLLNVLLQVGKLEYQILPNQRVRIAKQIGPDNGAQYRYGYNIKTLSRVVDTTDLKTRIRGYGAEGLGVIYTSPNASKFGIVEADPVHDDRFRIAENLVDYIKNQLQDEPLISIELDTVELINRELGEQIWLIYEPLDIEIKSRILSKRSVIRNGELVTESVVIGNSLPKSTSDLFSEQKLEYDTQNKVNRSKIEQANERITLEVDQVNESIGRIELQADRLELSVNNLKEDVGSSITLLQEEMSLKVNKNGVIGAINLSPERVDIDANKINFNGKVFGSSDAHFLGQVQAESIVGNEISGVTVRTSNASRYVHLENQELVLKDGNLKKLQIGFIDNNGVSHNTPYIIMGQGRDNNRDKLVMEKFTNLFELKYLAQNGDSSVRMSYDGNLSINAVRTIYFNGNAVSSNAIITAPDFKPSSTVKLKTNIEVYDGQAMDVINRIGVYSYYLKQDLENRVYDNKYLGFIAEGATEIKSGDAISLYKAVAYQWKALQEKDEEIRALVRRVDDLERVID